MALRLPSSRWRWVFYAAAGVATLFAIYRADRGPDDLAVVAAVSRPSKTASPERALTVRPAAKALPAWPLERGLVAPSSADPFAAADWDASAALGGPSQPVAAAPPPRPTAPELPFRYLGRWMEDSRTTVFLERDGHEVSAQVGTSIDGLYKVASIGEEQMVLVYLPLKTRQTLVFANSSANDSQRTQAVNAASDAYDPESN
ncbi:MAG: putative prolin-rich transrane protein [Rhizobacter sp.]|nr:putative prolin-rich transrane protein [Rhizobacter sp.]